MNTDLQIGSKLIREDIGEEVYAYYALGNYVVRALGVCGGRPTFKYTRIEVSFILNRLAQGKSIEYIVDAYQDPHLTVAGIQEAMTLASRAFSASPQVAQPLTA
ncbi:MAG: DUF433 domain-containing protein [Caldilineaceae bacterium]